MMNNIFAKYNMEYDVKFMEAFLNETRFKPSKMETVLSHWYEAKNKYLLKLFGDKLTIDCGEVEFQKEFYDIEKEMNEDDELLSARRDWHDVLNYLFRQTMQKPDSPWRDDYETSETEYYVDTLRRLTSFYGLVHPEYYCAGKHKAKFFGKDEYVYIHCKQKPAKIFSTFYRTVEKVFPGKFKKELADARMLTSKVMSTVAMYAGRRKTKGHLYLSIHPFDYITMSQNDCGWDSCMVLKDDCDDYGDYCAGTIATMNSQNAIIAYLDSDKPYYPCDSGEFKHVAWNNKKYRNIFVVDPMIISGVRGYPNANFELDGIILHKLAELAKENLDWNFDLTIMGDRCDRVDINGDNIHFHTNKMYNDADCHDCRFIRGYHNSDTQVTFAKYDDFYQQWKLKYDGDAHCVECDGLLGNSSIPTCYECRGMVVCDHCGDQMKRDEVVHYNGNKYCSYCYREHFIDCDECGEKVEYGYSDHGEPANAWVNIITEFVDWDGRVERYKRLCEERAKEAHNRLFFFELSSPRRFDLYSVKFMCENCIKKAIDNGFIKYDQYKNRPENMANSHFIITEKGMANKEFMDKVNARYSAEYFSMQNAKPISLEEYQQKIKTTENLREYFNSCKQNINNEF